MRIEIDKHLLKEALRLSGGKSKKEAVNQALAQFVQGRKQKRIMELFNAVDFDPEFDYKRARLSR